jgi:hypothetical protein
MVHFVLSPRQQVELCVRVHGRAPSMARLLCVWGDGARACRRGIVYARLTECLPATHCFTRARA